MEMETAEHNYMALSSLVRGVIGPACEGNEVGWDEQHRL